MYSVYIIILLLNTSPEILNILKEEKKKSFLIVFTPLLNCSLTTGVVKEAWPLRKELDTDRLRPRAGSASSTSPAGGGRIEKEEEADEEGEV